MSAETNPYTPPSAPVDDVNGKRDPQAEKIRMEYIKHETSLKAVGILFYAYGALVMGGYGVLAKTTDLSWIRSAHSASAVLAILFVLISITYISFVGRGLRTLEPWTYRPTVAIAVIGLLGFPFLTLISAYVLWLVLSKKTRFVLSQEYAEIIAATPNVARPRRAFWELFLTAVGVIVLFCCVIAYYNPGR